MLPIQDTCRPRPDILQGSFNPEIFTASLSQVMDHYRGKSVVMHTLYTDAEAFFREATYPSPIPSGESWPIRWEESLFTGRWRPTVRRI